MYVKQTVRRASGNPGLGIQPRDLLVLIDVDDLASFPSPDDKGVVLVDDIVMKPGRYGIGIYMTPGTAELTSQAEGDPDQVGFTPSVKFNHPGNNQEVREFKHNWLNRKCIAIVQYCAGKGADVIGSPCNPCRVTPNYTGNNESNTNEITVAQISKGDDIKIYKGTLPLEEPVATVETGLTAITYKGDGQYQLTSGSAAISSITGGKAGDVVTLLGTSGTAPTVVATAEKILLTGGKVFTASEGSQITLRAFDTGGDNPVWIEQSRFVAV